LKRNFRASKGTSIIPTGNNLVMGGLDVASLAAAAVKLSGFAPTFSNSYVMDQLGTRTAHASKFYSGNMGGDGSVKNNVEVMNVDQFIEFCHVDIYRIVQCNNSSSNNNNGSREEQNRAIEIGVLPSTVSDTLLSTPNDVLKQYDRFLYLETSQGVLVYFPDLKRKEAHSDTHSNRSMNFNKRRNENVLEEKSDRRNKNSWRTRGNGEQKERDKEKKGRGKERRGIGKGIGKGKGSAEGSGNDDSGDSSSDDVGNWRDNESESDEDSDEDSEKESDEEGNDDDDDDDDEAGEDADTPNFRNSLSPTVTHSKTGSSSTTDRHVTKQDNNSNNNNTSNISKTKKKSSGDRKGPSAVRPVQGAVWKLLAPSSDDVAVGEILDGVVKCDVV
jgi:hypothetical protein